MKRASPIFITVMVLCSCLISASANKRNQSAVPRFRFEITDRPQQKKFLLTLRSLDNRPLCMPFYKWPNRFGQVHFGSSWVRLESSEGTHAIRNENFGYCVGPSCIIHIPPGSTLYGFIGYEQFGDPTVIARLSQRKLRFPVLPDVCEK
jgi:hypothetical protein